MINTSYLSMAGLHKLVMLNLEGCNVTAACLDSISGTVSCYGASIDTIIVQLLAAIH